MKLTKQKPFCLYENLKRCRATTELKIMQYKTERAVLVKYLITTIALISAIAGAALLSGSTFFLGISLGALILSVYFIHHNIQQTQQLRNLFSTAKSALEKT